MKLATLILFAALFPFAQIALAADAVKATRSLEVAGISEFHLAEMVLKAAAEHAQIVGLAPDAVGEYVSLKSPRGNLLSTRRITVSAPQIMQLVADVSAAPQGTKPRANDYVDAIVASVQRQLQEFHANRTNAAERKLDKAEARLKDADAKASAIEDGIRDITGRVDASVDAIRSTVPRLEEERQSLKLQVIGKQARQEALAKAIERQAKAAEQRLSDDEVTEQLQKILKTRVDRLELVRKLFETGDTPQAQVHDAEAAVAEANTRILERRDVVKLSAGGGEVLTALNRELAMLSIDVAEAEAKLNAIEKLLQKYRDAQGLLSDAERLRRERERLDKSLDLAEADLRDAKAAVPEPVLRVLESGAAPAASQPGR